MNFLRSDDAAILGAVLVQPRITIPVLAACVVAIVWYWLRLGRGSVLPIRRRLRRAGLSVALVTGLLVTTALSGLDADLRPWAFILAWGGVLLLVLLAVGIACLDALVTIRLHHKSLERQMVRDALVLRRAVESDGSESTAADEAGRGRHG